MQNVSSLLRTHNLRDTAPRRLVLAALSSVKKPSTHKEICDRITKRESSVDLVTVYRVLEKFEACGIVHRHPSTGKMTLCSMHDTKGHHGFLSCEKCGTVEEFSDPALCMEENRIAKKAGFRPKYHMSEIIGFCKKCS